MFFKASNSYIHEKNGDVWTCYSIQLRDPGMGFWLVGRDDPFLLGPGNSLVFFPVILQEGSSFKYIVTQKQKQEIYTCYSIALSNTS